MKISTLNVNTSKTIAFFKTICPPFIWAFVYRLLVIKNIDHNHAYLPHYAPWADTDFAHKIEGICANTGLKPQSLYTLHTFLKASLSSAGDVLECGVWRGGSAKLLRNLIVEHDVHKKLYLFDSFEGMAVVNDSNDRHNVGDFSNTSLDYVKNYVSGGTVDDITVFRKGWIPETFAGLEDMKICFAHIDLDLYQSILDALNFIYPRLSSGGHIVFDDYAYASCPGAKKAVDEFFADKPDTVFVLGTAQAVCFKK